MLIVFFLQVVLVLLLLRWKFNIDYNNVKMIYLEKLQDFNSILKEEKLKKKRKNKKFSQNKWEKVN